MPTSAPQASTSSSHRIMRVAFAWIVGVFFFLPISILPAQELADILEVADRLDDESFCQVVSGVRQGIQGRKISSPESFSAWMAKVKKRSDPAALQQAILLGVALGDEPSIADASDLLGDAQDQPALWRELAQSLAQRKVDGIVDPLLRALDHQPLRVDAIRGLNRFNDPRIVDQLLERIDDWPWRPRNEALQLIAARTESALKLCRAIQSPDSKLTRQEIPAFIIRKMRSLDEPEVNHLVSKVWGDVNATPAEKKQKLRHFQNLLVANVLDSADLKRGKELVSRLCLTCHQLHGEGQQIGPNLTGSQRGDLYYVLHNIIHPSAEIDRSMRLTTIEMENGRFWSGIVARENDQSIDLQTATEKITLAKSKIEVRTTSNQSMMPDGILDALSNDEVRDLIAYLMNDKRQ